MAPLLLVLPLLGACATNGENGRAGSPGSAEGVGNGEVAGEVRFVLEVGPGEHPPVYVQLASESRPVGWLRVIHRGRTIHVEEQCAIPDCEAPDAVCGANLPVVRQIASAGGAGRIEYTWDGTRSEIEVTGCERRVPSPPGDYLVRVCWSHDADIDGDPRSEAGAVGRVVAPTCEERSFRLGRDARVELRIP